jgi:hypothetical protein
VCGRGYSVGNPNGFVQLLDGTIRSCADVEALGQQGFLSPDDCPRISLFQDCDCGPNPGYPICVVCGACYSISNPDAVVVFPEALSPPQLCSVIELAGGSTGFIDPLFWPSLPAFIASDCDCRSNSG